jgi:microcystin-dependent protein
MPIARGEPMLASDILNLTFFPKGAILTFSSAAWGATSTEFKTIWKVCDTANHQADPSVPDLTDKFLRGSSSSGATGGTDNQSITLTTSNLPSHSHSFTNGTTNSTSKSLTGSIQKVPTDDAASCSGIISAQKVDTEFGYNEESAPVNKINIDATHSHGVTGAIGNTGSGQAFSVNTVPAYYTVIYIIKVA